MARNVRKKSVEGLDEVQITPIDCIFGTFLASLNIAARLICLDLIEADWSTDTHHRLTAHMFRQTDTLTFITPLINPSCNKTHIIILLSNTRSATFKQY